MASTRKLVESIKDITCENCIFSEVLDSRDGVAFCIRTLSFGCGHEIYLDSHCGMGQWCQSTGTGKRLIDLEYAHLMLEG